MDWSSAELSPSPLQRRTEGWPGDGEQRLAIARGQKTVVRW